MIFQIIYITFSYSEVTMIEDTQDAQSVFCHRCL